jgi:hypothetical protein
VKHEKLINLIINEHYQTFYLKKCNNDVCLADAFLVGSEVLTAVVMKSTIFWDITPSSPLRANRRFGGTYRLHLQGRRISRARNQRDSRWQA